MDSAAAKLLDIGTAGLVAFVCLWMVNKFNRQPSAHEVEVLNKLQSIAQHSASIDDGMREVSRYAQLNELRLDNMQKQLDRIETRNV